MRLLVISHTYGIDLNCEKLRSLAHLDPNVQITVGVPKRWQSGGVQHHVLRPATIDDGNFRRLPLGHLSRNHQGLLCFGPDLVRLLRQFRPQMIQVEQGAKSLAYAQTITLNRWLGLGAKNLLFTWWNLPYQLTFPVAQLEAYNLRHTHGLIAGNQAGADILRQRGYSGPTAVMPQLGVDETQFRPHPQPALARQLRMPDHAFVVGYVGRFVVEKGLLTLADALTRLRSHPWVWLLVGRGPLKATLMAKMAAAGLTDRVRWVDRVPHNTVPPYLNLMHTLVLPSETSRTAATLTALGWQEQFGHVLIEAMAAGVPVIGSDCGEIPQVIGTAGLVFPEGNAAALSDRLQRLMTNSADRQLLAQQGRDRVLAHYTNTVLARQLLSFYHHLGVT
ncbi:MAG: glycosyltransferase family 4 protein [Leptolyngbya sp. LCM1.Bin17]|nr:MAG: glycosyltransferase family 4 protein [Leptolyngbya sp. LCM1.Bin17]